MKLRILVVTTSRADYGLLKPLVEALSAESDFEVLLAATGSHLSEHHGHTLDFITSDGFNLAAQILMNPPSNDAAGTAQAVAAGIQGFSQAITGLSPHLMVVLGDRFELLAACDAALLHRLPIAHLHGGERTEGALDEAIRHMVTKMAALHFPAMAEYGRRIVQMGERPERVFVVGALGIDNALNVMPLSRAELSEQVGVDFNQPLALMTFHPVTLDGEAEALRQIDEVLGAVLAQDLPTLVTMPNADPASDVIYRRLLETSQQHPEKLQLRKNLGQRGYLSAMRYATLMLGNSSSGVIETPSFALPTVNIGDRQKGRFLPQNVIQVPCERAAISGALAQARSTEFKESLKGLSSPFGKGDAAQQITQVLRQFKDRLLRQPAGLLKKSFFDLPS
ncbi:MAG: UDP-N-acetylglucosamine 2-epimerase [bacterium]|nr:UDP-N-acetylglucosamine 2-epimerase [bacterium]